MASVSSRDTGSPRSEEAREHLGETDLGTGAARGLEDRVGWGRSGDPDGEGTEGLRDVRERDRGVGGWRGASDF